MTTRVTTNTTNLCQWRDWWQEGGVLTQVIGWWQEGVGWVAGGGRVGGSQKLGNVNTEYTEHWDTGADNIQHTT